MSDPSQNEAEPAPATPLTVLQALVLAVMPTGTPVTVRWEADQLGMRAAHISDTLLALERRDLVRHQRATPDDQAAWGRQVQHLWARLG